MPKPAHRTSLRRFRPSDRQSSADSLASAFEDDPMANHLIRGYDKNTTGRRLYRGLLWIMESFGMTDVAVDDETGEVVCVSMWEPAEMTFGAAVRTILLLLYILILDGPRMLYTFGKMMMTLETKRHQLAGKNHLHLQMIGTDRAFQSNGIGSRVLRAGIERAERMGCACCYLESSNPANVPFYERNGFRVLERIYPWEDKEDRGPVVTLMIKELQAAEPKSCGTSVAAKPRRVTVDSLNSFSAEKED